MHFSSCHKCGTSSKFSILAQYFLILTLTFLIFFIINIVEEYVNATASMQMKCFERSQKKLSNVKINKCHKDEM